jgi:DNA-nicking Smr family endonuclease
MREEQGKLRKILNIFFKHGGYNSGESKNVKKSLCDIEKRLPLLEKQAAKEIFVKMNFTKDMGPSKFDFHGLHVNEAKQIARENIAPRLNGAIDEQITIVTGRGRHSRNGKSEVKEAVQKYFIHDLKMRCENVPGNEGVLAVSAINRL